jgi:hypothetical protein
MESDPKPSDNDKTDSKEKPEPAIAVSQPNTGCKHCCRHEPKKTFENILLVGVLLATSVAAYFTGRQWLTADDQERRSLRAYIGVSDQQIHNVAINQRPRIQVKLKNFGQTPATEATYWIQSRFDTYPTPVELPEQPFRRERVAIFPQDMIGPAFDVDAPLTAVDMTVFKTTAGSMFMGKLNITMRSILCAVQNSALCTEAQY